jgi:hypothetical protein
LGVTVQQLTMLISKEFIKLVLIAFIIAAPFTRWLINDWLKKYAFHINIGIWMLAATGVAVLLLTLVVVSLNTIRPAIVSPFENGVTVFDFDRHNIK